MGGWVDGWMGGWVDGWVCSGVVLRHARPGRGAREEIARRQRRPRGTTHAREGAGHAHVAPRRTLTLLADGVLQRHGILPVAEASGVHRVRHTLPRQPRRVVGLRPELPPQQVTYRDGGDAVRGPRVLEGRRDSVVTVALGEHLARARRVGGDVV